MIENTRSGYSDSWEVDPDELIPDGGAGAEVQSRASSTPLARLASPGGGEAGPPQGSGTVRSESTVVGGKLTGHMSHVLTWQMPGLFAAWTVATTAPSEVSVIFSYNVTVIACPSTRANENLTCVSDAPSAG